MKRITFLVAAAALLAGPALAQQGFDQKTKPGARPLVVADCGRPSASGRRLPSPCEHKLNRRLSRLGSWWQASSATDTPQDRRTHD